MSGACGRAVRTGVVAGAELSFALRFCACGAAFESEGSDAGIQKMSVISCGFVLADPTVSKKFLDVTQPKCSKAQLDASTTKCWYQH